MVRRRRFVARHERRCFECANFGRDGDVTICMLKKIPVSPFRLTTGFTRCDVFAPRHIPTISTVEGEATTNDKSCA